MNEILGKPGRLVEYRKGDIRIPDFQRDADEARIKRGAREFNWYLFGVLYTYSDGRDPFVLDGRHRLGMSLLRSEIDLVPCMAFDLAGHEQAAELFVMLQRFRKPLVTHDMHNAELFAGGEFGRVARLAEDFTRTLDCETYPLATVRKLVKTKPEAFERVAPLIGPLVGPGALHKDFIEAATYLEDSFMHDDSGDSLAGNLRGRLFDTGYDLLILLMTTYHAQTAPDRVSKIASPRMKAEALKWALDHGHNLDEGEHGARVRPAA